MGLLDIIEGQAGQRPGSTTQSHAMSPMMLALMGVLAYRTLKGKGRLAGLLGAGSGGGIASGLEGELKNFFPGGGSSVSAGGFGGGLENLVSGAIGGGGLAQGLQDLVAQFHKNGQGDKVQSWVSDGPNKPISAPELEQALGNERIEWLMKETGLSREQLLSGLSKALPEAVNKLTPQGHVPDAEEAQHLIEH